MTMLRTTVLALALLTAAVPTVLAAGVSGVLEVCADRVVDTCPGDFPFALRVGSCTGGLGVGACVDHSYDASKTADCKGVYVNTPAAAYYSVECYNDPNCHHYVDYTLPVFGHAKGCNIAGAPVLTTLWPYLP